ncbi:hypothetical protein NDU88_006685 [Pleurodeles waltl]|uniref:Uncharacterized protein n=1 Tax=Pleurodeles waltl TaxID=8319 RepID=A0AAV7PLR6_PLEWA|nr:hypothetical protein NDU88_006685 [Pleurodeles waltl]
MRASLVSAPPSTSRNQQAVTGHTLPISWPPQSVPSSTTTASRSSRSRSRANPGPRRNPPPSVAHRASTASSRPHSRLITTCSPTTVTSGRHCSINVLQRPGPEHQGPNRANPQLHAPLCANPVQPPANSVPTTRPPSQAAPAGGRGLTRPPSGPRHSQVPISISRICGRRNYCLRPQKRPSGRQRPKKSARPLQHPARVGLRPPKRVSEPQAQKGENNKAQGGVQSEPTTDRAPWSIPQMSARTAEIPCPFRAGASRPQQ